MPVPEQPLPPHLHGQGRSQSWTCTVCQGGAAVAQCHPRGTERFLGQVFMLPRQNDLSSNSIDLLIFLKSFDESFA